MKIALLRERAQQIAERFEAEARAELCAALLSSGAEDTSPMADAIDGTPLAVLEALAPGGAAGELVRAALTARELAGWLDGVLIEVVTDPSRDDALLDELVGWLDEREREELEAGAVLGKQLGDVPAALAAAGRGWPLRETTALAAAAEEAAEATRAAGIETESPVPGDSSEMILLEDTALLAGELGRWVERRAGSARAIAALRRAIADAGP